MSIVISGASGQLGRLTAELVLDRMLDSEVILTTRRPEALSDLAERGATIREGYLREASDAVENLTGRPPRSLREVFEAHRDELLQGVAS